MCDRSPNYHNICINHRDRSVILLRIFLAPHRLLHETRQKVPNIVWIWHILLNKLTAFCRGQSRTVPRTDGEVFCMYSPWPGVEHLAVVEYAIDLIPRHVGTEDHLVVTLVSDLADLSNVHSQRGLVVELLWVTCHEGIDEGLALFDGFTDALFEVMFVLISGNDYHLSRRRSILHGSGIPFRHLGHQAGQPRVVSILFICPIY
mmetsp:Transcript_21146/g.37902  ORF Transcript_21146/g.37902 Transcript_21146/m.37902 type:complete len:204 (-) Transcript_21146:47-658(-)